MARTLTTPRLRPLGCALRYGHEAVARLLLTLGASVTTENRVGQTPLMVASDWRGRGEDFMGVAPASDLSFRDEGTRKKTGATKALRSQAPPPWQDEDAASPGDGAPGNSAASLIGTLMVAGGANPDVRSSRGESSLEYAVRVSAMDAAAEMIFRGAR